MLNIEVEPRVHVVVGIVTRGDRILLAQRGVQQHQGGKWEFPGGKVATGEGARDALLRELHEELGIVVRQAKPLIRIPFDYEDRRVLLDVWIVSSFDGEPEGREAQPLQWVSQDNLANYPFPPANRGILAALQLPPLYVITDRRRYSHTTDFLAALDQALAAGVHLIQLREHWLADAAFEDLAREVIVRAHRHGARVIVNRDSTMIGRLGADGVHLTSRALHETHQRPVARPLLVGVSCHTEADLRRAEHIDSDFAVLSPVLPTASHPDGESMGWERFSQLCDAARIPVYALGGMEPQDLDQAVAHGGQGLAMIRGIWSAPSIAQAVRRSQLRLESVVPANTW